MDYYNSVDELRNAIDAIESGVFSPKGDPMEFIDIVNNLKHTD